MTDKCRHWERYEKCDKCGAWPGKKCMDQRYKQLFPGDKLPDKKYICKGRKRKPNITERIGNTVRYKSF